MDRTYTAEGPAITSANTATDTALKKLVSSNPVPDTGYNANLTSSSNTSYELLFNANTLCDMLTGVTKRQILTVKRGLTLFATDLIVLATIILISFILTDATQILIGRTPVTETSSKSLIQYALLFCTPIIVITSYSFIKGHYASRSPLWVELRDISRAVVLVAAIQAILLVTLKFHFSRLWLGFFLMLCFVTLPVGRIAARKLLSWFNVWDLPTLIIGNGLNAKTLATALKEDKFMGHSVIGFLDPESYKYVPESDAAASYCNVDDIKTLLSNQCFSEPPYLVFAMDTYEELQENRALIDNCISRSTNITFVPPISGIPLYGAEMINVFSNDAIILKLHNNLKKAHVQLLKRVFDVVVATAAIIALSPLLVFLWFTIKKDGGAAIYKQQRYGKDGQIFDCYKFRSMVTDADQLLSETIESNPDAKLEWEKYKKLKNDPRITSIGRVLRKASLDELPQLFNVLENKMSLVGPRPIPVYEKECYGEQFKYYTMAKPGITGLWQVSGRSDASYLKRVQLDTWYVRNWALWMDIVILFRTLPVIFSKNNGAY